MPPRSGVSGVSEEDHADWVYGVDKRAAEDAFKRAWEDTRFPFTSLRLPMVNSELDHHDRIYGYWLRLRDGGPIVIPEGESGGGLRPDGAGESLPLRHVYGGDAVQAILRCVVTAASPGRAYNISQDERLPLETFLEMLASAAGGSGGGLRLDGAGVPLRIARVPRQRLEEAGLLPACSPFSGRWMSVLDNRRSKQELGMTYTPVAAYLERLVKWHASQPLREIAGYRQRAKELELA
jgi:nucleoside-diphosphate-sugar epimerase